MQMSGGPGMHMNMPNMPNMSHGGLSSMQGGLGSLLQHKRLLESQKMYEQSRLSQVSSHLQEWWCTVARKPNIRDTCIKDKCIHTSNGYMYMVLWVCVCEFAALLDAHIHRYCASRSVWMCLRRCMRFRVRLRNESNTYV